MTSLCRWLSRLESRIAHASGWDSGFDFHHNLWNGHVVYAVRGAGLVKIGCTNNITKRMKVLSACSPVPLHLAATAPGYRVEEGRLHKILSDVRVHNEWFVDDGRAVAAIQALDAAFRVHFSRVYAARAA